MSEGGGGTQIDGITDVRFRILKRGVIPLRVNGSETILRDILRRTRKQAEESVKMND